MRRSLMLGGLLLAATAGSLRAEPPKVDGIYPAGGQRGTEFGVKITGKLEPWPLQARCDDERITFTPEEKTKGSYAVHIPADVPAGPVLVRFFNAEGATAPRQFMVGAWKELAQSGSQTLAVPMDELPLTVNGRLESSGAVDRFALALQAGQVVVARVVSYALDAPVDPLLHLRGPQGEQLAFNHDANWLTLDPLLMFKAPAAATYELHLSAFAYPPRADVRFTGGATAIYRLTLGRNLLALPLPKPHEQEGEQPQTLALPASISGRIDPPGDVDRFRFSAGKGQSLQFEIEAARLGSWMDPVLRIRDESGKLLKREDDGGAVPKPDVAVTWKAPAEGTYLAEVSDLNGAGGERIAYRFALSRPAPHFGGSVSGGVYAIAPGKELEIAVKAGPRHGFKGDLEVGVEGLPPGVSATPAAVSAKGEAKLALKAVPEAAPANVPLRFWCGPKDRADQRVTCRIELKGATTDAGDLLLNETERGWLTVLEAKKP